MKTAVYIFAVVVVCVTVCIGKAHEKSPKEMQKSSDGVSKREECKDKFFKFVCTAAKKLNRCNVAIIKKNCAKTCGHCVVNNPCKDIFPLPKCLYLKETDKCWTDEARANCGTTCESCGKACKNYIKQCGDQKILDELCTIPSGGFLLCPRGCNLCIDRE